MTKESTDNPPSKPASLHPTSHYGKPAPTSSSVNHEAWNELDAMVLQWIYIIVSDDLLVHILYTNATAQTTRTKLEKILFFIRLLTYCS
ncbi:hypothetical protein R6Q59_025557 [Mikania micrantha]